MPKFIYTPGCSSRYLSEAIAALGVRGLASAAAPPDARQDVTPLGSSPNAHGFHFSDVDGLARSIRHGAPAAAEPGALQDALNRLRKNRDMLAVAAVAAQKVLDDALAAHDRPPAPALVKPAS